MEHARSGRLARSIGDDASSDVGRAIDRLDHLQHADIVERDPTAVAAVRPGIGLNPPRADQRTEHLRHERRRRAELLGQDGRLHALCRPAERRQRSDRQLGSPSDLQSHSPRLIDSAHHDQGQTSPRCPATDGERRSTNSVTAVSRNRWIELTERKPGHSEWYVERFRSMAAAGDDLDGEARFIDAMASRRSRILDAGCGPGRVGSYLARAGHEVVGVDIDPILIAAAEHDHPGPRWLVADLAELDLPAIGLTEKFDIAVCAGNVLTFLDPDTRRPVLTRLVQHLRPGGRIVTGFGSGRDYAFDEFLHDVDEVGLSPDLLLASWDLRPFTPAADFLVAVLSPA